MKSVGGFLRLCTDTPGSTLIRQETMKRPPEGGPPSSATAAQISLLCKARITSCLPVNRDFWLMLAFQSRVPQTFSHG